ncbi:MAG TPA: hypothetical protein VHG93_23105, partial [Longimicrobium sp.]|nr:hypothetical protein [Longimicrobium sp.]
MTWDWKRAFDSKKRGPSKERVVIGGGVLLVIAGIAAAAGAFRQPEGMTIVQGTPSAESMDAEDGQMAEEGVAARAPG